METFCEADDGERILVELWYWVVGRIATMRPDEKAD